MVLLIDINYRRMYEDLNSRNEEFEKILLKLRGDETLSTKNLITVDSLTVDDVKLIFRITMPFKEEFILRPQKKIPILKGKSILNFFAETSTRTRVSFELAGKHLNADTVNISKSGSSMDKKGETLNDTARTLQSMKTDCIILRHWASGACETIASQVSSPVINAGDGWHEHPSQALLDAYTICEAIGTCIDKKIVIVGDILHSRVAGSLIRLLTKLNAEVILSGPTTLIPMHAEEVFGVKVEYDLDKAIKDADVIYALRIQVERAAAAFIPSIREYSKNYCINSRRLKLAKKNALVMHPGPINREVDLSTEVMEGPQSYVEEQVTNGFALRMALLYLLIKCPFTRECKQTKLVMSKKVMSKIRKKEDERKKKSQI